MKNTIANHTESFKRMRQQQIDFINNTPFYGAEIAEKLYKKVKVITIFYKLEFVA